MSAVRVRITDALLPNEPEISSANCAELLTVLSGKLVFISVLSKEPDIVVASTLPLISNEPVKKFVSSIESPNIV